MSDAATTTTEPEQSSGQAAEHAEQPPEAPAAEPQPEDEGASKEAAKYRRRLRDAEAERDTLQTQAEAAQRSLVDTLAQHAGVRPAALWASGATLDDLTDDHGHVDPELVQHACDTAASNLGLARTPRADHTQGGMGSGAAQPPDFADAFRPRR